MSISEVIFNVYQENLLLANMTTVLTACLILVLTIFSYHKATRKNIFKCPKANDTIVDPKNKLINEECMESKQHCKDETNVLQATTNTTQQGSVDDQENEINCQKQQMELIFKLLKEMEAKEDLRIYNKKPANGTASDEKDENIKGLLDSQLKLYGIKG